MRERVWPFAVTASTLFAFWLLLSGRLDAEHIGFGVFSAALVAVLTREVERIGVRTDARGRRVPVFTFSIPWPRFLAYLPWLIGQVILANLQVAYVILHPRLPIAPVVVRFPTRLQGDLARATLGNSITLTPGTITIDVDGEEFVVHALTREAAREVLSRTMEKRVARAFGQA
ncbi:MAG: Na+/H+ antiporter subunit E [Candidatus Rokubacteria bacterium]|nr:Na+/H+ antiporter subunit E [Candidatus Rokubacteria bacterium]